VNKTPQRVGSHEPQQPQNQQYNSNRPQHDFPFPFAFGPLSHDAPAWANSDPLFAQKRQPMPVADQLEIRA